jgi:hypothetical protein
LAQAPRQCGSCITVFASQNSFEDLLSVGGAVVLIRKATGEDANGIFACLAAAFDEYRDSYTSGAFADTVLTAETIAKRLQKMTVFVATEKSGEIVGTIACGVVNAEKAISGEWRLFPLRKALVSRHDGLGRVQKVSE